MRGFPGQKFSPQRHCHASRLSLQGGSCVAPSIASSTYFLFSQVVKYLEQPLEFSMRTLSPNQPRTWKPRQRAFGKYGVRWRPMNKGFLICHPPKPVFRRNLADAISARPLFAIQTCPTLLLRQLSGILAHTLIPRFLSVDIPCNGNRRTASVAGTGVELHNSEVANSPTTIAKPAS